MRILSNNQDFKSKIKILFSGHFSKKYLTHFLGPLTIIAFTLFMAISCILYPNYDWLQMTISSLGDPISNPIGWIFWSIGLALTGIFTIPIISYLKLKLMDLGKIYTLIGTLLLYFAAIGLIGLGVIPQFPADIFSLIHVINASLTMGGMFLGIFFLGIPFLKSKSIRKILIPVAIFGWGAPIGFLITQGIRFLILTPLSNMPWFFSFTMWEWMLQYGILGAFIILVYLIPENLN